MTKSLTVLDLFAEENMEYRILECGTIVYENGVIVSRLGRNLSLYKCRKTGYLRVEINSNGKGKKFLVHRLVALAFIPNPENKPQVNHKDGNKTNNFVSNLEWVTQSENQKHAYRIGLQKGYSKPSPLSPSHKAALCGSRWKNETRTYHAEGLRFPSPEEAAKHFGMSRANFYLRAKSSKHPTWFIEVTKCES